MSRCGSCGKVNKEGSAFCQDCGGKLVAAAAAPVPAAGGTVCPACNTANPPGMNFCKMCGTSLARPAISGNAPTVAAEAPNLGSGPGATTRTVCTACNKQTPVGFAFCQHCGHRLSGSAPAAAAPATTPVAKASEEAFARTMAPTSDNLEMIEKARASAQIPATAKKPTAGASPATLIDEHPAGAKLSGRLVTVRRDGTDGEAAPITGETFDIGRSEGALRFSEDPFLAPRHARLVTVAGKVTVRALDTLNGVYVRIQGGCDLSPGDDFIVGKEMLRFEPVAETERESQAVFQYGTRLFGSYPRESWGRVRQISIGGTTRDVWHVARAELVLGREEGDVTFPDDEFMSRRHAAVRRAGEGTRLEDLGSSNGTFIRIRGDRALKNGDVLRLGDQLLRFEA